MLTQQILTNLKPLTHSAAVDDVDTAHEQTIKPLFKRRAEQRAADSRFGECRCACVLRSPLRSRRQRGIKPRSQIIDDGWRRKRRAEM